MALAPPPPPPGSDAATRCPALPSLWVGAILFPGTVREPGAEGKVVSVPKAGYLVQVPHIWLCMLPTFPLGREEAFHRTPSNTIPAKSRHCFHIKGDREQPSPLEKCPEPSWGIHAEKAILTKMPPKNEVSFHVQITSWESKPFRLQIRGRGSSGSVMTH